jgi:hypothetical protein
MYSWICSKVGLPLTITDQVGVIWHKVIICDIGSMDYSKRRFFISYFHAIEIAHCIPDSTLQVEVYNNKFSS